MVLSFHIFLGLPVPSALATDLYQLTMMAGYEAAGLASTTSTFELFVRELPAGRNYLMAAGLDQALEYLETLHFTPDDIAWLRTVPALAAAPARFFDEMLRAFRFTGEVWAVEEGEIVFAREPLIRVTARVTESQMVETALLAILTFQTSVASKASRVVTAGAGRAIVEFGSRRAHGLEAACLAARAACLAGCTATSNVEAGRRFDVPLSGTMAHSWVMAFDDELDAFRNYMDLFGEQSTLLIDTYDTEKAAEKIVRAGLRPSAVRLDSGDLVRLSQSVRAILDAGGLPETRILVSGDLDEHRVAAVLAGGAPIDAFGVGTAISAVSDAPALGGIYKLVETIHEGRVVPTVKLSSGKQTYPGRKQVWRMGSHGMVERDVVGLESESPIEGRPLLSCVMRQGKRLQPSASVREMARRARARLGEMPAGVARIDGVAEYPVSISELLDRLVREAVRAHM